MAGIWERIKPAATDRVAAHLVDAGFVFIQTGTFTQQQVVDAINATVNTPLDNGELTDLTNIASQLNGAGSVTNRLVYLEKIKAAFICAEMGAFGEAAFRSALGIA